MNCFEEAKKLRRSIFLEQKIFLLLPQLINIPEKTEKFLRQWRRRRRQRRQPRTSFFLSLSDMLIYILIFSGISRQKFEDAVENKRLIVVGGQQVFLLCSWMSSVELRLNTTVTVWSIKLSNFETGKYLGGWPLENSCWRLWASPTSCCFW